MKSVFAFGGLGTAVALAISLLPACSSTPAPAGFDPPVTRCDPAQCAAGNSCFTLDGDLKCRKPCSSNVDAATSCPSNFLCAASNEPSTIPPPPVCTKADVAASKTMCATLSTSSGTRLTGYTCVDVKPKGCVAAGAPGQFCCNEAPAEELAAPVCVKQYQTQEVTPGPKQWGVPCDPRKGIDNNADCDVAQGFRCYGTAPAAADAYCTRYDCTADRECAGGYTCATINVGPNVTTSKRTYHETRTACLRRDYCARCKADVDCPPLTGLPQHCVPDANGAGFCSPECKDTKNCNLDATCQAVNGAKVCYPRARVCVGDGSLCSPCRSDADCGDDGACVKGEYTTERFCAKKSATKCTATSKQCPTSSKTGATLGCAAPGDTPSPLDSYCYGLYEIAGEAQDLGCWTPNR